MTAPLPRLAHHVTTTARRLVGAAVGAVVAGACHLLDTQLDERVTRLSRQLGGDD